MKTPAPVTTTRGGEWLRAEKGNSTVSGPICGKVYGASCGKSIGYHTGPKSKIRILTRIAGTNTRSEDNLEIRETDDLNFERRFGFQVSDFGFVHQPARVAILPIPALYWTA